MSMSSVYDVVVFGATSFVGQILSDYLCNEMDGREKLSWAMAGRSQAKLDVVKAKLGDAGKTIPTLVVDANDAQALTAMCEQTRVVASTVGPYGLYGEPLVKACVETGTDYCDLTGEPLWVEKMIGRYESTAKASGARIIHCVGLDSIPSDMGVYFTQQQAKETLGQTCSQISMRAKVCEIQVSGGSAATGLNTAKEIADNPKNRMSYADPYSLCPDGHGFTALQHEISVNYERDFQSWVAPFLLEAIDVRVVHRSNALSGNAYGKHFQYSEGKLTGQGVRGWLNATSTHLGLAAFNMLGSYSFTRNFLTNYLVPKPGEGMSPEDQHKAHFDFRFIGRTPDGQTINTRLFGKGDPGYLVTGKMMGQAAACLALDISKEAVPGGFLTPAVAFGNILIERLHNNSVISFSVTR